MSSVSAALALTVALQTPAPAPASPPPDETRGRPLTHLFQNLAHDVVQLPSAGAAILLGAGSAATFVVRRVDDDLGDWAGRQSPARYTSIGRISGDGWVQAGAALATYGGGLLARHRPTVHLGSDLIRAQALNGIITRVAKAVVGRRRPSGGPDSMPSGHSSAAFTTASVLAGHLGWKAGVPAYTLAGFVAWTRVRDHVHWPTDVVMGATVGMIVGHTVTRNHPPAWMMVPTIGRGTVGLTIVRRSPSSRVQGSRSRVR